MTDEDLEKIARVAKKGNTFADMMNLVCNAYSIIEPMKGYPLNNEDKGLIEEWLKMFDRFTDENND